MSRVTNVIFTTELDDAPSGFLEAYLLKRVDQYAGGGKAVEVEVYMSALNFLDPEEIVSAFYSLSFENPEGAQLMIKEQEADRFKVFNREEES